jgi:excinuclease ABC subunit A
VLHKLRNDGNTIVVIEHNLDVIKTADWVIDLGPEGGHRGGQIIARGTPEDLARMPQSWTGQFLARTLKPKAHPARTPGTDAVKRKSAA